MGLDTVELVMELEDEFEISIPDADAEKLETLGQTFDYILSRLRDRQELVCPSARAFYKVRRELMTTCGIPREAIQPDSQIGDLLPDDSQRRKWKQVARQTGLPVPPFDPLHPLTARFPPERSTLRALIRAQGPARYIRNRGTIDPNAIWERIREIVSEQLGVHMSDLHRETHYIKDLGVG